MNGEKPWYQSKRIIGSIAMAIVAMAALFGTELDLANVTNQVIAVSGAIAWIVNLYGSIVAKDKITMTKE